MLKAAANVSNATIMAVHLHFSQIKMKFLSFFLLALQSFALAFPLNESGEGKTEVEISGLGLNL